MSRMNMDRFGEKHDQASANSGLEFGDIERLVVANGAMVRLVGDFATVWEHFVETDKGWRPFYCEGPESDCPLCAAANQLSFSDDPTKQELGKRIKAKEKFYFNVLDRSPAGKAWHGTSGKTKILAQSAKAMSIGGMLFKAIGDVVNMRKQQGKSYDPNDFDIMLTKSGSGMQTKYGAQFTGDDQPLDEAEQAYEQWPLDQLSKLTPRADREAVAQFVLGHAPSATAGATESATDFNPANYEAPNPVQAPAPQAAPAPAAPPPAAPPPAVPPKQAPPQLKPAKQEPADTTPYEGYDESTHMKAPCGNCGVDMLINLEDGRDLRCHNCGAIFRHPANS